MVKKLSDYNFSPHWRPDTFGLDPEETYLVLTDLRDLKKGALVKFVGFDDVDNHYGIFVFTDSQNRILEVSGDVFGGGGQFIEKLKRAITKASAAP